MEDFLIVDIDNRRLWFDVFYLLAFMLAFFLLIYSGKKRGYPILAWLLMLATGWLLFVIGCKLPAYTAAEWQHALSTFALPATTKMTVLGGLVLGSIGIYFGRWWSRLPLAGIDLFAIALPLGMVVQRLGCFVVGCCYGIPGALPWSVKYPVGTLPHAHQYGEGLIGPGDQLSLAVHPTQLYELVAALCTFGLVMLTRRYWKVAGSAFLSSLVYYGTFRFFTEFFMAGNTIMGAGDGLWGLSVPQLVLLLVLPLFLGWLLMRESKPKGDYPAMHNAAAPALGWHVLLILLLVTVFWLLRNWFALREILVLNIVFIPLIAVAVVQVFQTYTAPAYRWLVASVLLLPLFLMGQTLAPEQPDSTYLKTYKTIGIGFGTGKYENLHEIGTGEGCDRISNTEYFRQEYAVVGGGFSVTREKIKETLSYGLNLYGGQHTETMLSSGKREVTTVVGVNPYVRYDTRFVGVGGGLHFGNLVYTLEDRHENGSGYPNSASVRVPVYPQLYVQVGPRDIAFVSFRLADHFPSAMPGFRYKYSIGTGFGLKNGTNLQVGHTTLNPFVSAYVPMKDRFVLESLYLWGRSGTINDYYQRQFSLGLHYRFGHQEYGVKKSTRSKAKPVK